MSELKDYDIMDIEAMDDERLEKSESGKIQVTRVYIKSEADEVISTIKAERDEYRYNLSCARNEICNMQKAIREDVKTIADLRAQIVQADAECANALKESKEADKVIAEKDKEIQRLENLCESYRIDCDNLAIREANAYERNRYKKNIEFERKRQRMYSERMKNEGKVRVLINGHRKYIDKNIAEKFKEVK